ncbi:MAG: PQQ-dependent sugar dehydrogenase [Cyclobacteriaceae bacterium]
MNLYFLPICRKGPVLSLFFIFFLFLSPAYASELPTGFVETRVAQGLDPTGVVAAPDGRIFITQKNGKITIVKNGSHLATPFLTLNVDNFNERGLMSIAFDPNFASNGYVYVFYTVPESASEDAHNRVSRFTASGDIANPGSELVLYDFHKVSAGIHNGGALFFKNGYLFATHGDNAYGPNSQNLLSNLGKVIRINPDGSIPTDNPFYNQTTGDLRAIWATGLRNPFKAGVDPQTGKIFINDVGQADYEEVNEGMAGANYGWPNVEGPIAGQTPPSNYQDPFYYYGRTLGCSITASGFYNPSTSSYPAQWQGKYFFGDYCNNYLKALDPNTGAVTTFATGFNRPLDVTVDNNGIMYVLVRQGLGGGSQQDNTSSSDGELWRIDYTGSEAPVITVQPQSVSTSAGDDVLFTVAASGTDLQYQWLRDGENISKANASSYLLTNVSPADDGSEFRVLVFNGFGTAVSNTAVLSVGSNNPPVPVIATPDPAVLYQAGQTIYFSGSATDSEDGTLPNSAYTWWVDFHHDSHTHPALDETSGIKSGSFTISRTNETSDNVWYRIYLRVTDSDGSSATVFREIYPRKADITLQSSPAGLSLLLDGKTVTAPHTVTGVVGITRTLEAPASQTLNGKTYAFSSWSDGGSAAHDINTPATNTTYTATYTEVTDPGGDYRAPENPSNAVNGLDYAYYEGTWYAQPNLTGTSPANTGTTPLPDLTQRQRDDFFAMAYTGYVEVTSQGDYTFYTASDDGSVLYIGNELVVDNSGLHGLQERQGTIGLQAGRHAIRIEYFEKNGGQQLTVSYSAAGLAKTAIPASAYYRSGTGTPPPPPPPPPAVDLLLEAENAVISGPNVLTWIPGYTGTGYVDYSGQSDDYIEWTADMPAAGVYQLSFRYVLGASAGRPLELQVNGQVVNASLDFPPTADWNDWQEVQTTVTLQAGMNQIRTTAIGFSGGNYDHLKITNASTNSRQDPLLSGNSSYDEPAIFPMPVGDELSVRYRGTIERAELLDATGKRTVIPVAPGRENLVYDVSQLPEGLYLLIIETDGGMYKKRVLKR